MRSLIHRFIFSLFTLLASPAFAQQPLALEPIASNLNGPLQVTHAPGDDGSRIFIVSQYGLIRVVENDILNTFPFLNINSKLTYAGERGLLGMAFHPDYEQNGYFYVRNYLVGVPDPIVSACPGLRE